GAGDRIPKRTVGAGVARDHGGPAWIVFGLRRGGGGFFSNGVYLGSPGVWTAGEGKGGGIFALSRSFGRIWGASKGPSFPRKRNPSCLAVFAKHCKALKRKWIPAFAGMTTNPHRHKPTQRHSTTTASNWRRPPPAISRRLSRSSPAPVRVRRNLARR